MSEDEKLEFGTARKEVGAGLFKSGRFVMALQRYKKVGLCMKLLRVQGFRV